MARNRQAWVLGWPQRPRQTVLRCRGRPNGFWPAPPGCSRGLPEVRWEGTSQPQWPLTGDGRQAYNLACASAGNGAGRRI